MNSRGQVCIRDDNKVVHLPVRQVPFYPHAGSAVRFRIDLTAARASFQVFHPDQDADRWSEPIEVDFSENYKDDSGETMQTGFFSAVVTNRVSVSLF